MLDIIKLNLDTAIFIGFLTANLVLGLYSSRGIKSIKEYAVGNRDFSTATIVATIVATWVSGNFIFMGVVESYNNGLNFIWVAVFGDFLCLLIVGLFLAPRMGEFLGKLSVAEAMGDLYGDKVRIVTALTGFIGVCGLIATQFKIAGMIFEYALEIPGIYGILSAAIIVTLYSALGGIKSVTFTDVIQFITFGTVIPAMAYLLFSSLENINVITHTLNTNPLFDYKTIFDFSDSKSLYHLFVFMFFVIPAFNPAIFQRIAMAKNIKQASNSFIISAVICLLLVLIVCWIGVLMLAIHPNIESNQVVKHMISDYSFIVGYKGIVLAGIMAMVMSTVDSYINSTSVIFVHDFLKPLKAKFVENELFSARFMSVLIGLLSLALSLREGSILELVIITYSLYMPIVTVPFIMSILGFRSTEKSVLLGMATGFLTVIVWDHIIKIKTMNSVPFGMIANLLVLMGSHYLMQQKGGWIGIKDQAQLDNIRIERKLKIKRFLHSLNNLSLFDICRKNRPNGDGLISFLGIFVMISAFASFYTLEKQYQLQYKYIIDILYPLTLCSSTALISYPLWLQKWKNTDAVGIVWNIIMFTVLICFSFLMVLISNFSEIQLMVFMINIIIMSSLITWHWALITLTIGITITAFCYQYISIEVQENMLSSQFKIVYLLLLIISTLVTFLKPKQDKYELAEAKVDHLGGQINDREVELQKSLELKYEFLRNIEHEMRTPITGITSLGQVLDENYDKFSEKQRKGAVADIARSSERLNSLISNILDLSKLSSMTYQLNKTQVNLTELLFDRIEACRKMYLDGKDLEFISNIGNGITLYCDEHYIKATLDNLIINAIQYSKQGKILISLKQNDDLIEFSITDEGLGIPPLDLKDIFGAFTVSSKTRTPAGGRGVGLALCKKVVDVHGGDITAESDGEKGATFIVKFPTTRII